MAGHARSAGRTEPRGGRVVPVYALTGGRTRATDGPDMPVESIVTVTEAGVYASDLQLEYRLAVELAATRLRPAGGPRVARHRQLPTFVRGAGLSACPTRAASMVISYPTSPMSHWRSAYTASVAA